MRPSRRFQTDFLKMKTISDDYTTFYMLICLKPIHTDDRKLPESHQRNTNLCHKSL